MGKYGGGEVTLEEHLKQFAKGDASEFDAFYLATKKTVYHIALGIMKERALAEDVMQSTYMKVLAHAGKYREGGSAAAWIGRIARNEALTLKKRRAREHAVDFSEDPSPLGVVHEDYGEMTDLARRVLSEAEFGVLMLAAVDGYKRREIAAMLKMPVPTVTWHYHRALAKLRSALEGGKA